MKFTLFGIVFLFVAGCASAPKPTHQVDFTKEDSAFHLILTPQVDLKTPTTMFSFLGLKWKDCSYKSSPKAAKRFTLTEIPADIDVRIAGNGAIVTPSGKVVCLVSKSGYRIDPKKYGLSAWEPGEYQFFPFARGSALLIGSKSRIVQRVNLSSSEIDATPDLNPKSVSLKSRPELTLPPHLAGVNCWDTEWTGKYSVSPLGRVVIPEGSQLEFSGRNAIVLVDEHGKCHRGGFKPGEYGAWMRVPAGQKVAAHWDITIVDHSVQYNFGSAPVVKTSAKPQLVTAQTRDASDHSVCKGVSSEPSFYVQKNNKSKVPINVQSGGGARVTIYGPIENQFKNPKAKCIYGGAFNGAEGKYAVWLTEASKSEAVVAVGDITSPKHLFRKTTTFPEDATLEDLEIGAYFPYYSQRDGTSFAPLVSHLPARAFVFVTRPLKSIQPTTPILLLSYGKEKSLVATWWGEQHWVPTSSLTLEPQRVVIDEPPPLKFPETYYSTRAFATPAEGKLLAKVEKRTERFDDCLYAYRAKNDPTFDKNYELVDRRTGENIRDRVDAKGAKKCGESGLISLEKSTAKKIRSARLKHRKNAFRRLGQLFPQ